MRLEGSGSGQRRNAKRLRQEMTPPEIGLWLAFRRNRRGLRFRKQHSAGNYILDFYCAPAMLAIEVMAKRMRAVTGRGATQSAMLGSPRKAFASCAILPAKCWRM